MTPGFSQQMFFYKTNVRKLKFNIQVFQGLKVLFSRVKPFPFFIPTLIEYNRLLKTLRQMLRMGHF